VIVCVCACSADNPPQRINMSEAGEIESSVLDSIQDTDMNSTDDASFHAANGAADSEAATATATAATTNDAVDNDGDNKSDNSTTADIGTVAVADNLSGDDSASDTETAANRRSGNTDTDTTMDGGRSEPVVKTAIKNGDPQSHGSGFYDVHIRGIPADALSDDVTTLTADVKSIEATEFVYEG
jgi:hypothetical protein